MAENSLLPLIIYCVGQLVVIRDFQDRRYILILPFLIYLCHSLKTLQTVSYEVSLILF